MLIDIHTHVTRKVSTVRTDGSSYTTPEELLEMLDRMKIDRAVLLPIVAPEGNHQPTTSDDILEVAAAHPDRFIPFCNIDPRQIGNTPDVDFRKHLEYYKAAGCKGLGEITANIPFDDPRTLNLFAQCEEAGMPVLFHIGPQAGGCYGLIDDLGLPRLEQALRRFPSLTFLGHSQPFWAEISSDVTVDNRNTYPAGPVTPGRVPELMRKYPNLCGDLSAGSGFNAISRDPVFGLEFLDEFQDRLLFGTDICATHNRPQQPEFFERLSAQRRLPDEAIQKICWKNADRILGLGLD